MELGWHALASGRGLCLVMNQEDLEALLDQAENRIRGKRTMTARKRAILLAARNANRTLGGEVGISFFDDRFHAIPVESEAPMHPLGIKMLDRFVARYDSESVRSLVRAQLLGAWPRGKRMIELFFSSPINVER